MKKSFDAIADERTRVVILGSLPGDKLLEAKQYYAHPTNQFWRLLSTITDYDLIGLPYELRLETLLKKGIGLWDVVASANRKGSLDTAIRDLAVNRLKNLQNQLPNLRAIAFNGGTAAKIGRRQITADARYDVIDLPSSSAGYCSVTLAWKQEHWNALKAYL